MELWAARRGPVGQRVAAALLSSPDFSDSVISRLRLDAGAPARPRKPSGVAVRRSTTGTAVKRSRDSSFDYKVCGVVKSPRVPQFRASPLRLRPVRLQDEPAVRDAQRAMAVENFEFAFDLGEDIDWSGYIAERSRLQSGMTYRPTASHPVSSLQVSTTSSLDGPRSGTSSTTGCSLSAATSVMACCHPFGVEVSPPRYSGSH